MAGSFLLHQFWRVKLNFLFGGVSTVTLEIKGGGVWTGNIDGCYSAPSDNLPR